MGTKRVRIALVLCLSILVCGCTKTYQIDWDEYLGESMIDEASGSSTPAPAFDYVWEPSPCAAYLGYNICAIPTSRGILLWTQGQLKCYDPVTGTIADACGDPLCAHWYDTDCAFADYHIWSSCPVSDGQYLYYIHGVIDGAGDSWEKYRLVKSDLFGLHETVFYESENELFSVYLVDQFLFFQENCMEQGASLCRYDLGTGECKSVKIQSEENQAEDWLIQTAFIPVGDMIYYVCDGDLYRMDIDLSCSEKVLERYAYDKLYTDGKSLYHVAWLDGIYKTDLTDFQTELVYQVPEGLAIDSPIIADRGISFLLKDPNVKAWSSSRYDEWISQYPKNAIYFYQFENGDCLEIPLEDIHTIAYNIYKGKIYLVEYKKRETGRGGFGDVYILDIEDPVPILLFDNHIG